MIAGQFRSEARREALLLRLRTAHSLEDGALDLAGALAARDLVLAAFAALSERDREVLRLVTWDGLGAAEAAEVLGVSRLAFAVRLHRARRRLSGKLAQADERAAPVLPHRRPRLEDKKEAC